MSDEREFEWSLRLHDGRYLRGLVGTSAENAARREGIDPSAIKRALPTAKILTPAEQAARAERFAALRKRKEESDGEED